MSFGRLPAAQPARAIGDINVTPLVDVVLVLLVIFIVAAPLMARQMALELPPAKAATPAPTAAPVVTLEFDARSGLRWNGEPLPEAALPDRLREAAQRDPATELQLRADASVPYGRVLALIAAAQAAGLRRVGFTARQAASPR